MGNTLINFELVCDGGGYPNPAIAVCIADFFYDSYTLDNTGKHGCKLPFFVNSIEAIIFAILKITGRYIIMLIIDSKDCENIDKALKKYKKKFEKSKVLLQLRARQSFTKPSVRRRGEVLKAIYRQQIVSGKIEL
jgi:small subunit ribosomal protein S21